MVRGPKHTKLEVVDRHPDVLIPYANNAREHSTGQLKKLVESVQEFGFTNPILIDENLRVLAGHGRLMAAKFLGMASVPTIVISNMSEAQYRAYILADNAIAAKAGWSKSMLRTELRGLVDLGYNVELTGFDTLEIDTLISLAPAGTQRSKRRVPFGRRRSKPTQDDADTPARSHLIGAGNSLACNLLRRPTVATTQFFHRTDPILRHSKQSVSSSTRAVIDQILGFSRAGVGIRHYMGSQIACE